jgi:hypothetical protein
VTRARALTVFEQTDHGWIECGRDWQVYEVH